MSSKKTIQMGGKTLRVGDKVWYRGRKSEIVDIGRGGSYGKQAAVRAIGDKGPPTWTTPGLDPSWGAKNKAEMKKNLAAHRRAIQGHGGRQESASTALPALLEDLREDLLGEAARPERLKYNEPIPPQAMEKLRRVAHDVKGAAKALKGRKGGLRPSKPKNGIMAFVWRMARFHSGADVKMPVTAEFYLSDGVEKLTGVNTGFGLTSERTHKEVVHMFMDLADKVLDEMGLSKLGAARAWRGLV